MLQYKWLSTTITTNAQAQAMVDLFKQIKPEVGGDDTETNGLHIINCKPFLYQFGFLHPTEKLGYTFVVDIERQPVLSRQVIKAWYILVKSLKIYLGHNCKFDMHMMTNYGEVYLGKNRSDTMFYIRYAHDALTPKNGGPPLALKDYTVKYIDPKAKHHEHLLKTERTQIAKDINYKLRLRMAQSGADPQKYGYKSFTIQCITDMFKDPIFDYTDLEPKLRTAYETWLNNDVPEYLRDTVTSLVESEMIGYQTLNRKNIITYGHYDIVYMLETYAQCAPVLKNRGQEVGLDIENQLIEPLYEMERVGFKADVAYIEQCRVNLKAYIIKRRERLYELAGQTISIGQHELIKDILNNDFRLAIASTGSDVLDLELSKLKRINPDAAVVEFIEIVQELRTLEKWYSTYILRFLRDLKHNDRLYTTINQVGTVSCRVTSDFQQFPRDPIKTVDGVELFHPRKIVLVEGGDYPALVYIDYSQIELRFQAFYTILVGHPDLNLCRAYMPYQCVNRDGVVFDYHNPDHIINWDKEWYLQENPETLWVATDVHGATTTAATGLTPEDSDAFKKARYDIGKRTNFAKNYGAQRGKIREMFPEKSEEEVTRIDSAYYTAFPGVKHYHNYCYVRATHFAYTENIFGIRYYGVSGHKLINLLIQGSAAVFLKLKIIELCAYMKTHKVKSKWQMQIHDELSWLGHKDESVLFFQLQHIMQDWSDTLVPIVAEMDATKTVWAEKKGVHTQNDLQVYFSN